MSQERDIPEIPAVTTHQAHRRNALKRHNQLWAAYVAGEPVTLPITPETYVATQRREVQATTDYWKPRGYRVRTQSNEDKTVLTVWLERIKKVRTA